MKIRDSKLTRILQDSLGGKCKTVVIATLSISTLGYAQVRIENEIFVKWYFYDKSLTYTFGIISTVNVVIKSASGIVNKPISTSYMSTSQSSA